MKTCLRFFIAYATGGVFIKKNTDIPIRMTPNMP